jgi:gas vesicle protein
MANNDRSGGSDVSTRLTYLLIGGGIGAVLALLFAPKSGTELRGDIADVTRKGVDRTREVGGQLGARAGEYYESASAKAGELAGVARDTVARRGEHLSAAIEAGKRAYTEEKRRTESSMMEQAPTYYEGDEKS